jgi:hypothetical protein
MNKRFFSKIMGVAGSRAGCEGIQRFYPRLFLVLFIKGTVIISFARMIPLKLSSKA